MTRHDGRAVFLAPYSVAAGLWAAAEAGVGYAAATSLQRILSLGGPAVALVALSVIGVLLRRRSVRRARRAAPARPCVPLTAAPATAPPRSSCPGPSAGCPSAE
jgi:hypothetical protein